ncbi:transcriptional regulator [Microtetraspora sp. AC03309]|uniref:helix-turn-helix transcriptional regulator n=1 Tax=Microtetraspora sp. AC03309 TaxID=2779376 RepID=UPI001E5E7007|nr:transcriptional regulator [Microtetraspora sp. AC03309]MCC5581908.1 transcriptional regulator [Microtetraspora sp. AC03309]
MGSDELDAVGVLNDPLRRELYRFVATRGREVGRNEAAEALGIQRTLAAFHLDKLADAGLLEADFRRLTERTGPGSGRPAKVYRRARGERLVSLPPRDYRTLALVLAEVVDLLGADDQAEAVARRAGERLARGASPEGGGAVAEGGGDAADDGARPGLAALLEDRGYEPYEEEGRIRLRNCPFHVLAERHPLLVCSMNLALCQGVLAGLADTETSAELDPRPGECCVVFSKNNES